MKITINVDCTPEEARRYMGLPDVAPMQEAMLNEMQERMMASAAAMQPAEMMQAWMPVGVDSWMEMQKQFWKQMMSSGVSNEDQS